MVVQNGVVLCMIVSNPRGRSGKQKLYMAKLVCPESERTVNIPTFLLLHGKSLTGFFPLKLISANKIIEMFLATTVEDTVTPCLITTLNGIDINTVAILAILTAMQALIWLFSLYPLS